MWQITASGRLPKDRTPLPTLSPEGERQPETT